MEKETKSKSRDLMADDDIIEMYWQRDERAIHETDRKYKKYLYTIAYNILHDDMDCEECLNDTYLGTWNTIPPQRPFAFQAFLSKIMRNTAVGKYKKNTALKRCSSELTLSLEELEEYLPSAPSAEEEYIISQIGNILNDYIRSLSARGAFVFICRYYCSDRIADIASMLNVSERTIFNELTAIREGLKKILTEEGYFNE